jgi:hypothetical protein
VHYYAQTLKSLLLRGFFLILVTSSSLSDARSTFYDPFPDLLVGFYYPHYVFTNNSLETLYNCLITYTDTSISQHTPDQGAFPVLFRYTFGVESGKTEKFLTSKHKKLYFYQCVPVDHNNPSEWGMPLERNFPPV